MLQYKGFVAHFHYIPDLDFFVAQILHGDDTISFSALTMAQLHPAMASAVDNYLSIQQRKQHKEPLEAF